MKLISLAINEAKAPPTYFVLDVLCQKLRRSVPKKEKVFEELRKLGFEAYPTLFNTRGIKTRADIHYVKEAVIRA